jgi:hypothetical protein
MVRMMLKVALLTILPPTFLLNHAQAQSRPTVYRQAGYRQQAPAQLIPQQQARPLQVYYGPAKNGQQAKPAPGKKRPAAGYVQLNAPLYSSPRQNIPVQTGMTIITNPAFAPHEMLHAHEYHAMYPPFYYKVRGSWIKTPWGVKSHDVWELKGTEVIVKYRSNYGWFPHFTPPKLR